MALAVATTAALAWAPAATAAPAPGASASPTTISRFGTSTVQLTLDGESSTQSTPTDLVLVLDESGSINGTEYQQMNDFAESVVDGVAGHGLFANGGTVGVVGFSNTGETVHPLDGDKEAVKAAIQNNPKQNGGTCISCGLTQAKTVLGADEPDRNEVVLVITDGNPNTGDPTKERAEELHPRATVIAVGVGDGVNQATLETVASGPGADNTFSVGDFGDLDKALKAIVEAIVVPGATNPRIDVTLDAPWRLVPGTVTANLPGSGIGNVTDTGFTWTRAQLGDENLVITYQVRHQGAPCGPLNVNQSVDYTDDEGAPVVFPAVQVTVECLPPVADAGQDRAVDEGTSTTLDGSASHDPDGTVVSYAWSGADAGVGALADADQAVATYQGLDDGADEVKLTVTDDNGLTDDDTATVTVKNVAPDLTLGPCPVDPHKVGTDVSFTGSFTDPGVLDTHTMTVDWGDGQVTGVPGVSSPVGAAHQYTAAGIYTISVTVTDDDGGSDTADCGFVVVYDPDGGFVTGGGTLHSPAGAYPAEPGATGTANFGFVSKYHKGAEVPSGQTEFQFKAGSLNFHSTGYQWLVVAGDKAVYKGSGTVNGQSGHAFMLTAIDGDPDRLRMRIWRTADDTLVYDNQKGAAPDADPANAISKGQIVIHKN
ncbi:VWA domain-containing protein [Streptomyces capparidis]